MRQAPDWIAEQGVILSSGETIDELATTLDRPRFASYVDLNERNEYLHWLDTPPFQVEVETRIQACRDPEDDKFLEFALSGNADVIISGDDDLLVLHPFRGIPLLLPSAFPKGDFVKS